MTENEIGKVVVDSAIAVHNALGSGLYEIVYEVVLAHELKKQVLTCLRLTGCKLGYLLNFGEGLMKDGISRIILIS
mgnify:FL=1